MSMEMVLIAFVVLSLILVVLSLLTLVKFVKFLYKKYKKEESSKNSKRNTKILATSWIFAVIAFGLVISVDEDNVEWASDEEVEELDVEYELLEELSDDGCNFIASANTDDLSLLAKELQNDYKGQCDSMFIKVGESVNGVTIDGFEGNIKIALTKKGLAQTGLDKIGYSLDWSSSYVEE